MKPWFRLLPFAVFLFILPFPGTVALRLLALFCGLVVCLQVWRTEGFPRVPAGTALLLWAACALFSLATAFNPGYSLGEIKNEIGYAMAAYLGFLTLSRAAADARFFALVLIVSNLAISAIALSDHYLTVRGIWKDDGIVGGSGSYSTYLITIIPALVWAGFVVSGKHRLALVLIVLQGAMAMATAQRMFWLAFAVQLLFALYLLRSRGFIALSTARLRIVSVAVLALALLVMIGITAKRYDGQGLSFWARDARIAVWQGVVARMQDHPLAGQGFGRQTMKNAYPDLVSKVNPEVWHPHNVFLNYGIAMGFPGVIVLLLLFATLLRRFWQLSRSDDRTLALTGICGVLLVVGVVARNLTNDLFHRDLALLFWSIAGILLGYAQHAKAAPRAPGAVSAIR
jgi:O-antigen ligase